MRISVWLGAGLGVFEGILIVLSTLAPFSSTNETFWLFVGFISPLIIFALNGYAARRKLSRKRLLVQTLLCGLISGVLIAPLFYLNDLLFYSRVSLQPEKIVNFQTSGFATLREYIQWNDVRNGLLILFLAMLGSLCLGVLGYLARRRFFRPLR